MHGAAAAGSGESQKGRRDNPSDQKMSGGPSGFRRRSPGSENSACLDLLVDFSPALEIVPICESVFLPDNAPFTRAFVFASAVLTVLFGVQGRSSAIGLSYQVSILFRLFWHP